MRYQINGRNRSSFPIGREISVFSRNYKSKWSLSSLSFLEALSRKHLPCMHLHGRALFLKVEIHRQPSRKFNYIYKDLGIVHKCHIIYFKHTPA